MIKLVNEHLLIKNASNAVKMHVIFKITYKNNYLYKLYTERIMNIDMLYINC